MVWRISVDKSVGVILLNLHKLCSANCQTRVGNDTKDKEKHKGQSLDMGVEFRDDNGNWKKESKIKKIIDPQKGHYECNISVKTKYPAKWDAIESVSNRKNVKPECDDEECMNWEFNSIPPGFYEYRVKGKDNGKSEAGEVVKIAVLLREPKDKIEEQMIWITDEDIKKHVVDVETPIENIVFSGGGSKGYAYCGVAKYLEQIGLLNKVKRYAGTSAGAIAALILALGYSAEEMDGLMKQDMEKVIYGLFRGNSSFLNGIYSPLRTAYIGCRLILSNSTGLYPLNHFGKWIGSEIIKPKIGKDDITFAELYEKTGKELCVVVTNLNNMREEYCHRKTTPDLSVLKAIKMSIAMPGMFDAEESDHSGQKCHYVDGGVANNYPIHCFDGWWLSEGTDNKFVTKLSEKRIEEMPAVYETGFNRMNDRTIGFLLYPDNEPVLWSTVLQNKLGTEITWLPETKLKKKMEEIKAVSLFFRREWIPNGRIQQLVERLKKEPSSKISLTNLISAFRQILDF